MRDDERGQGYVRHGDQDCVNVDVHGGKQGHGGRGEWIREGLSENESEGESEGHAKEEHAHVGGIYVVLWGGSGGRVVLVLVRVLDV